MQALSYGPEKQVDLTQSLRLMELGFEGDGQGGINKQTGDVMPGV